VKRQNDTQDAASVQTPDDTTPTPDGDGQPPVRDDAALSAGGVAAVLHQLVQGRRPTDEADDTAGAPQVDPDQVANLLPMTSRRRLVGLLEALDLAEHDGRVEWRDGDDTPDRDELAKLIAELKADGDEVIALTEALDRLIREHAILKYAINQALTGTVAGRPKGKGRGFDQGVRHGWNMGVQAVRRYLSEASAPCDSADVLVEQWALLEGLAVEYGAAVDLVVPVVPDDHHGTLAQAVGWLLEERAGYSKLIDAELRAAQAQLELEQLKLKLANERRDLVAVYDTPAIESDDLAPLVEGGEPTHVGAAVRVIHRRWLGVIDRYVGQALPDLGPASKLDLSPCEAGGLAIVTLVDHYANLIADLKAAPGDGGADDYLVAHLVSAQEHHGAIAVWCEPRSFRGQHVTGWKAMGVGWDGRQLSICPLGFGATMVEACQDTQDGELSPRWKP